MPQIRGVFRSIEIGSSASLSKQCEELCGEKTDMTPDMVFLDVQIYGIYAVFSSLKNTEIASWNSNECQESTTDMGIFAW